MAIQFINALIKADGQALDFDAGSLVLEDEQAEKKVRTSVLGNSRKRYISEDVSTGMAKITFTMPNSTENFKILRDFKASGIDVLTITDDDSGFSASYNEVVITNKLSITDGQDNSIAVEMEAAQQVII